MSETIRTKQSSDESDGSPRIVAPVGVGDDTVFEVDTNPGWGLYNKLSVHSEWDAIMSTLGLKKSPSELLVTDLVGKRFASIDAAELFYSMYSAALGFGVRKGALRLSVRREPINRTWLCCKEGLRESKFLDMPNRVRTARGITREGCLAKLRINWDKRSNVWIVKAFVTQHSHQLAATPWVQFMRDKRNVSEGASRTVRQLRNSGIRTTKILSYMAQQVGGYDNVRFIAKDLYNYMGRANAAALADDDAERAIGYLQAKADTDPDFYGKFSYGDDNRLLSLFWADSKAISDYARFGDVLSFDTTYKTNLYGKPLLVFVGVNNHFLSTIFGYAILEDEVTETYKWALSTFLDSMGGSCPKAVITDGDLAMRAAILEIMPTSVHRLCSWHIENNLMTHVKVSNFLPLMKMFMFKQFSEKEFGEKWNACLEEHGLANNAYLQHMYEKRHLWAETFVGGTFFAGMNTTQRCEKMHSLLKSKVTKHMTLVDFLRGIDVANSWLRHRQGEDEYKSFWTKPVTNVSNMPALEEAAAAIYTPTMFFKVLNEMRREGKYVVTIVEEMNGTTKAILSKYGAKDYANMVSFVAMSATYECQCKMMNAIGIPCRHIFSLMKALHAETIPPSLIKDRWRRSPYPSQNITDTKQKGSPTNYTISERRFGHLSSKCSEMAHLASKNAEAFELASTTVATLTGHLHSLFDEEVKNNDDQATKDDMGAGLKNPFFSSTKGGWTGSSRGGKGKKKCSKCHQNGHNKATCTASGQKKNNKRKFSKSNEGSQCTEPPIDCGGEETSKLSPDDAASNAGDVEDVETSQIMERIGKGWWGNCY